MPCKNALVDNKTHIVKLGEALTAKSSKYRFHKHPISTPDPDIATSDGDNTEFQLKCSMAFTREHKHSLFGFVRFSSD